jgi:cell pole-organizing protein PopZ
MSEQAAPEPTMEEILASIRRIISEDDAPAGSAEAEPEATAPVEAEAEPEPHVEPEPEPVAAEAPVVEEEDDVLELTEKVSEPEPAETHGDIDVYSKADPEPEPAPEPMVAFTAPPEPEPVRAPLLAEEALVGEPASVAAASSFGKLSAAVLMPSEGRTLEDVTRELLRPLLKAWLDENLPAIVQAKVDEEVERIARSRVR